MLYKYTASARFLDEGLIRFTQPGGLNDPNEAWPIVRSSVFSEEDYEVLRLTSNIQYSPELLPHSPEERRILEFLAQPWPRIRADEKTAPGLWLDDEPRLEGRHFKNVAEYDLAVAERALECAIEIANHTIGILSLTRSQGEHMWAHYAGNHTGMRIGFDDTSSFVTSFGRAVEYTDHPISITVNDGILRFGGVCISVEDVLNGRSKALPLDLFFRKRFAWSVEEEWRVIRQLNDADKTLAQTVDEFPVHLFEVPKGAVREVAFGLKASDDFITDAVTLMDVVTEWSDVRKLRQKRMPNGAIELVTL